MIWALLISFVFKSIRETVIAKRRGDALTLSQSIRSNFIKLGSQIKQKFFINRKPEKIKSSIETVYIENEISK